MFFVVWTPDTLHIEEIQIDVSFFEANATAANTLIERAMLPEVIGSWFTKPRKETESKSAPSSSSTGNEDA